MSQKKVTFTVMHDKGEWIDGKNVRPYETFQSIMTDEYKDKVKKGWLILGLFKETQKKRSTR